MSNISSGISSELGGAQMSGQEVHSSVFESALLDDAITVEEIPVLTERLSAIELQLIQANLNNKNKLAEGQKKEGFLAMLFTRN